MKHITLKDLENLELGKRYQWGNKSFYFEKCSLYGNEFINCYSYNTLVGHIYINKKELVYTIKKYSRTTSKQMTQLKNGLEDLYFSTIPAIRLGTF